MTSTGAPKAAGKKVTSDAILVPNPVGLHARPASVLSNIAAKYESEISLKRGEDQANAKSVIAIMGMEVRYGDKVRVVAYGADAEAAVADLAAQITVGLGEEGVVPIAEAGAEPAAPAPAPAPVAPAPRRRSDDPNVLLGVAASPGLGVGTVVQVRHEDFEVREDSADRHRERRLLNDAIDRSQVQLAALEDRLANEADADKAAIFAAHREILRDPDLMDLAMSGIDKGKTAAFAWRGAYQRYADRLAGLKSEVLAGRAVDVRDVGQRVLQEITGQRREQAEIPAGSVLIAEDLTPSDTVSLDPTKVVGFCTTAGGASSHVAILARALDIPAVAGIDPRVLDIAEGTRVILDGANGTLQMNVTEEQVERIRRRQAKHLEQRAIELAHADEPAMTSDGHHMEVVANIGGLEDAQAAVTKGAEGVGLLRSEFVFLERRSAPSEDEQAQIYTRYRRGRCGRASRWSSARWMWAATSRCRTCRSPRRRTRSSAMRGIRVGLDRPEILRTQVRAILRAVDAGARST